MKARIIITLDYESDNDNYDCRTDEERAKVDKDQYTTDLDFLFDTIANCEDFTLSVEPLL